MQRQATTHLSDDELAQKAAGGVLPAFSRLHERWYARLYNFTLRYMGSHDEAMEACQQSFIKAHRALNEGKYTGPFRSWIYIITGNTCRDMLRSRGRLQVIPLQRDDEPGTFVAEPEVHHAAEKKMMQQDSIRLLNRALQLLPDEQRLVLVLKEYEGLKFHEIAAILDEPESTVKSRLYYALKNMKKIFERLQLTKEHLYYGS